ncbi:MAG: ABC transporter ATP-binding protein [Erysipelotrichales bacterium]|nr:ABC transporter ATP-binding protein [Erysipelotrichales bacterium]
MSILTMRNVTRLFGGLAAVSDANLYLNEGELVGLIGPNGAGKTTLFNLITGVYEPSKGEICLEHNGEMVQIGGKEPYKISQLGISRTFQNIRLFKSMTVLDNLLVAMHKNCKYSIVSGILRLPSFFTHEEVMRKEAMHILEFVGLDKFAEDQARNLSYGEQRKLEIARALATHPKLLFLDEPAAGMNPQETAELTELIHKIRDEFHVTILLIEHDMSLVMNLCERIYVLDYGRLIANGTPEEIKHNKRVIEAYLGEEV